MFSDAYNRSMAITDNPDPYAYEDIGPDATEFSDPIEAAYLAADIGLSPAAVWSFFVRNSMVQYGFSYTDYLHAAARMCGAI